MEALQPKLDKSKKVTRYFPGQKPVFETDQDKQDDVGFIGIKLSIFTRKLSVLYLYHIFII